MRIDIDMSDFDLEGPTRSDLKSVSLRAAEKVHYLIQQHFRSLPGRDFYKQAAAETDIATNPQGADAAVQVHKVGVRLQWTGGTVKPSGKISIVTGKPIMNLLIPVPGSPLCRRDLAELNFPEDEIKVIPREGESPLLVHVLPKRKGKPAAMTVLGTLHKSVTINPHPEIMPTDERIRQQAREGAIQQLQRLMKL